MNLVNLDYMVNHLTQLCGIPSPSGNTQKAMDYLTRELDELEIAYKVTNKGAVISTIPGQETKIHRHIAAHVDTLGAEIKANGRLKLTKVGGYNWNSVEGALCYIETSTGKTYSGTILNTHSSVHVYEDHTKQERKDENMELRIDEKVKSPEDVVANTADLLLHYMLCQ